MAIAASHSQLLPAPGGPVAGRRHDLPMLTTSSELVSTLSTYGRRQEIYGEGEEAACVYQVICGAVRSYNVLSDGRRQISAFHLLGDIFGLEVHAVYGQSAEAIIETTVMVYPRRQFEAAAHHDVQLACELWSIALRQLEHRQAHVLLLGRRSALERVAAFLAEIERRSGEAGWFDLPMTRRDIADYLGLTIETVSRAVSQLEADGALLRAGARRIRLCHAAIRQLLRD
ncbi:helix-turn-helix domain-containing protein [Methylobacterium nodulans]|uniref:Transcriptional regulator, Crp/Fnr family n=1 Tax=Methylobacterium nodulans (strain LMG 21967 / CNCM I-2342 / ORS 2060) TaxID=460265 RepID=B8IH39_METNO|nr:helix-turn-helix domain-containing protein [Methylobacterium nodulans]ACL59731.1 transcriptional regulator, Crp/Fnr family [Methylobacterium nodulans ORS 2060]